MLNKMFRTLLICPLFLAASFMIADQFPDEFTMKQRAGAWTTTFDIQTNERMLGALLLNPYSVIPEYQLMDTQQRLLSFARMNDGGSLPVLYAVDQYRDPIGSIHRQPGYFYPTFHIISPTGKYLAKAVLNFWSTSYTVSDYWDGHTIAEISRPFFHFGTPKWTIKILDQTIHPLLYISLLPLKVDMDRWAAEKIAREMEKQKREMEERKREAERQKREAENQCYVDLSDNYYDYASGAQAKESIVNAEDSNEAEMVSIYRDQLETFRAEFECIYPTLEDFKDVEAMTESNYAPSNSAEKAAQVESQMDCMFSLMSSDTLQVEQKAALFIMLKSVLEQPASQTLHKSVEQEEAN